MAEVNSVIDWIFTQFASLFRVVRSSWVLAVPFLAVIFAFIIDLIRSIYDK